MKHHFIVSGMTCLGCVATVRNLIKTNKDISSYIGAIDLDFTSGKLTVELVKRLDPNPIIDVIMSNKRYKVVHTHTLDDQFTYYFEIKALPSEEGGKELTPEALRIMSESVGTQINIEKVKMDFSTARAKIITNAPVSREIIENIKGFNYDAKLLTNKKTYYFVIKGLTSPAQEKQIQEALERCETVVDSFQVKFSTNTVGLTIVGDDSSEKTLELKARVKEIMCQAAEDIVIEEIQSPIEEYNDLDLSKKYFSRFRLNFLAGLGFVLLNLFGLIIPPLTLIGQAMGLFLGGITLGVMWQTGREFYQGAWQKFMKDRSSDMDTMIALGTGAAWLYSMVLVFFPTFFPIAAIQYQFLAVNMILGIINLGASVRAKSVEKANKNVQNLAQVYVDWQNQLAKRVKYREPIDKLEDKDLQEEIEVIGFREIKMGDKIRVVAGELFPVDGTIVSDTETLVNQSAITGEAMLCERRKGQRVLSGTLNTKHAVDIRASCDGSLGSLTSLIEDVEKSNKKSRSEGSRISKLVDKLAAVFVPTIIGLSFISAVGWFVFGPVPQLAWMIKSAMSVLLCACPCALGLATPISTTISIYKLFQRGIIVRNPNVLESVAQIDTVVFDKTNTLTTLTSLVKDHILVEGLTQEELLYLVASLEDAHLKAGLVDHPIAKMLVSENSSEEFLPCSDLKNGEQGVSGVIDNKTILVGARSYLEKLGAEIGSQFKEQETLNDVKGLTSVFVALAGKCVAVITLSQQPRKGALEEVTMLKKMGIQVYMLTGDNEQAARKVADELGITKVYFDRDAKSKQKFIEMIQKNPDRCIAMLGDGINDMPAIEVANVGIGLDSSSSASSNADITLRNLNISTLIIIAREMRGNIHQNLWGTGFYNLLSLSAAMGLWYPWFGFVLNPIIASLAMSCSSIFVVFNSSRLAFVIDNVMNLHEKKSRPATFFENLWQFCSLKTQIQTLRMFLTSNEAEEDPVKYYLTPDNNVAATPPRSSSTHSSPVKQSALPALGKPDLNVDCKAEPSEETPSTPAVIFTPKRTSNVVHARGDSQNGKKVARMLPFNN